MLEKVCQVSTNKIRLETWTISKITSCFYSKTWGSGKEMLQWKETSSLFSQTSSWFSCICKKENVVFVRDLHHVVWVRFFGEAEPRGCIKRETKGFIIRNWLRQFGGLEIPRAVIDKLEAQEGDRAVPAQKVRKELMSQLKRVGRKNFLWLIGNSVFSFSLSSPDWMWPTHHREDSLLFSVV